MSSTFQAVIRGPNLTPLGNRPVLMPAHHVDRETGKTLRTAGRRMWIVEISAVSDLRPRGHINADYVISKDSAGVAVIHPLLVQ